jgi:glycosyltransferase involved in cell wall biosynthesis
LKVIQVLNHFLPHQIAGTEVYTWALGANLVSRGVEVRVVIPNHGKFEYFNYLYDGLIVHKYSEPSVVDRALIMGFRKPEGLKSFGNYLIAENPDIVHFHELAGSNGITLEHVKLVKSMGFKVIMTFHLASYSCKTGTLVQNGINLCDGIIDKRKCGVCYLKYKGATWLSLPVATMSEILLKMGTDFRKLNHPIGTLLGTANVIEKLKSDLMELVNLCDQVVCLTNWYREILVNNGIDDGKIKVIEQGLPLDKHEIADTLVPLEKKKPLKLIFLGRISKFKGLHLLLDAMLELPREAVELSIYGNSEDGEYEINLRNQTVGMLNIKWMGKLDQSDVISTISRFDLLCLCSTFSEMSPLVIQEAKAAKIPVLASNVYGNSEQIIHDVNGLLFEINNVLSLKNQIYRILNQPELLPKLRMNITQPRGFELVGEEYLNIYQQLFGEA